MINLKKLNEFVQTEHFKMKGISVVKDTIQREDWMVKVDLKDAYFMVPIHKEHRALLKFQFQEATYQFQCLPFGLACAPWAFTKVTKPVIALLRQLGVRLVCFINDVLIMAETPQLARDHGLVENLGFIISHKKWNLLREWSS